MHDALKPVFAMGLFYRDRTGREDKLGGLPFGFPVSAWPTCRRCGLPQVYIAQFHASARLRLGREGRTLYLFQCRDTGVCDSWEAESGANRALLVDADAHTGQPTTPPSGTPIEPEGIIVGWEPIGRVDDPLELVVRTYLGGAPAYGPNHLDESEIQGRFLLQLVGSVKFGGAIPTPDQTGAQHLHYRGGPYGMDNVRFEEPPNPRQHFGDWSRGQSDVPGRPSQIAIHETGEWGFEWANFGGGTAYVFMDDAADAAFYFWER
jgi:hypothetical protein